MFDGFRYIIVGSGLTGAVLAERIAAVLAEPVLVLERRAHPGGNAYSSVDPDTGIECHRYGSHIFHTRHEHVWNYMRRFGEFTGYRHHVFTEYAGNVYSMPISLDTINRFYNRNLRPREAEAFIKAEADAAGIVRPANLEEKAVSLIGRPLYEAFIKGYTWKQWNRDPRELPAEIITRLPVRTNYNTEYFDDRWQGVPLDGYGALLQKMLDHPHIALRLGTNVDARMLATARGRIFHTGMIDRHFDYCLGALEWRSLRFDWQTLDVADFQGASVMNAADRDVPYTRIHEFKHYHPERRTVFHSPRTVICREYPQDFTKGAEPYYPVNDAHNRNLHRQYQDLARHSGIRFCGRLGGYVYADMDTAVNAALELFETEVRSR